MRSPPKWKTFSAVKFRGTRNKFRKIKALSVNVGWPTQISINCIISKSKGMKRVF